MDKTIEKKVVSLWPFMAFMLSYTSLFYFIGHFDALDNVETSKVIFFGFNATRGDAYFITLTAIVILIYLSLIFAYKVFQSNIFSFKEFAGFTAVATIILPISVWGLAWIQWFSVRDSGSLILWKVGAAKIAVQWSDFMPLHIALTIFLFLFTFFVVLYKLKIN
jgi:hypothetical protein